jgi:hypothetical protein
MSAQASQDPWAAITKGFFALEVLFVIAAAVVVAATSKSNPYDSTFGYQQNPLVDSVAECREFESTVGTTGPGGMCNWLAWEDAHANDGETTFWTVLVGLNVAAIAIIGTWLYRVRSTAAASALGTTGTIVCFACQSVVPRARRCRQCGAEISEP